jgi:hypothetical protein
VLRRRVHGLTRKKLNSTQLSEQRYQKLLNFLLIALRLFEKGQWMQYGVLQYEVRGVELGGSHTETRRRRVTKSH